MVVFVPIKETKAAADWDSVPLLWPSLVLWINKVRSQQMKQQTLQLASGKFPAVSSFRYYRAYKLTGNLN